MAKKLTNRQLKELRDAFNMFDRDKSGAISLAELKEILRALNFNPTDILLRKVMKEMDTDGKRAFECRKYSIGVILGNGTVELDEFVKVMSSMYTRKFTDEEMRRAFQCFDRDNSGFITRDELRMVISRLNPHFNDQRITEVLNQVDLDRDGKISYQEFVEMLEDD